MFLSHPRFSDGWPWDSWSISSSVGIFFFFWSPIKGEQVRTVQVSKSPTKINIRIPRRFQGAKKKHLRRFVEPILCISRIWTIYVLWQWDVFVDLAFSVMQGWFIVIWRWGSLGYACPPGWLGTCYIHVTILKARVGLFRLKGSAPTNLDWPFKGCLPIV